MACESVGKPMPDIAGLGILIGFAGQAAISFAIALWVFFLSSYGRLEVRVHEGVHVNALDKKRLEMISEILMVGNDIQMLTGIALMVTAFISAETIDTYHLHLIYDTVSFAGVSNAAALVCWTFCTAKLVPADARPSRKSLTFGLVQFFRGSWRSSSEQPPWQRQSTTGYTPASSGRHRTTGLFALLFLVLTILLCVRLDEWDDEVPGRCFNGGGTSAPGSSHPGSDKIYVGVTAGWLLLVMLAAAIGGAKRRHGILIAALAQFPVHLYMMIALRTANQHHLESEGEEEESSNPENEWDFGQTAATLLLGVAVAELISKGIGFWRFERELKNKEKYGPEAKEGEQAAKPMLRVGESHEEQMA